MGVNQREVASYIADLAGELASLAERNGLHRAAYCLALAAADATAHSRDPSQAEPAQRAKSAVSG